MRLDHRGQNILHRQRCFPLRNVAPGKIIGRTENGAQIVRRVSPFSGQPGVVEIQVANQHAQVKSSLCWLEFKCRTRHPGAARHLRTGNHGAQQLPGAGKLHRQQRTSQAVHQAVAGRRISLVAVDFVGADIICDINQHLVVIGPAGSANTCLGHSNLFSFSMQIFLALIDRNIRAILRTDIVSTRPDEAVVGPLFKAMRSPSGHARHYEDGRE